MQATGAQSQSFGGRNRQAVKRAQNPFLARPPQLPVAAGTPTSRNRKHDAGTAVHHVASACAQCELIRDLPVGSQNAPRLNYERRWQLIEALDLPAQFVRGDEITDPRCARHSGSQRAMKCHRLGAIFETANRSEHAGLPQRVVARVVRIGFAHDAVTVITLHARNQSHAARMRGQPFQGNVQHRATSTSKVPPPLGSATRSESRIGVAPTPDPLLIRAIACSNGRKRAVGLFARAASNTGSVICDSGSAPGTICRLASAAPPECVASSSATPQEPAIGRANDSGGGYGMSYDTSSTGPGSNSACVDASSSPTAAVAS